MCEFSFRSIKWPAALFVAILTLVLASENNYASDPASLEFFESRIRPVLVEHCYECHNSAETHEANLRLDVREGLLRGGDNGPSIVVNAPENSLLLKAISHSNPDLKMPPNGVKLSNEVIDDFRKWIAAGATDPRDKPPTATQMAENKSWEKVFESRKKWWSFQPIREAALPSPQSSLAPIDQWINARLDVANLQASQRASSEVLIRRLYFNLLGLPPNADELAKAKGQLDQSSNEPEFQAKFAELVDGLLSDKRFGERWARHWMDWIRYAESHGSEGDPAITNAWMYRDYLIRSLNRDIPINTMIREHIAGDLIPPRIDNDQGLNESLIATAHWRMVFHGFSPTDALDERVRFIDDQINAFSKAFLGVTVSCARCHDHKFEPISQQDYYALYGVLSSCRPGRRPAESDEVLHKHHPRLHEIKNELRVELCKSWRESLTTLPSRLQSSLATTKARPADQRSPLENQFWQPILSSNSGKTIDQPALLKAPPKGDWQSQAIYFWDLDDASTLANWKKTGVGLEQSTQPGELIVSPSGNGLLEELHAGGVTSRAISNKDSARLSSPDFECPKDCVLWVLAEGDGGASLRYVVQNYPRNGTIYPTQPLRPGLQWHKFDIGYWSGDLLHVEVTAARDAPLLTAENPRSWFRVCKACVLSRDVAPPAPQLAIRKWLDDETANTPGATEKTTEAGLFESYSQAVGRAFNRWSNGVPTKSDIQVLNACLKLNLIGNDLTESLEPIKQLVEQYRQLESELVVSNRVPCLEEAMPSDARLYVRGDHRRPDKLVPRRFLEAIDAAPYGASDSGRLQLADKVLADNNPLTRRVVVNRIWHHLFGAGIVPSCDNFGRLGAMPTHPELLDWLSDQFAKKNWSLKSMIKLMVMSQAWQRSSAPNLQSMEVDPDNQLLSHSNIRRYEAESLRDCMLAVAGNIDSTSYGTPANNASGRRSVYLPVIRNSLNPLLRTFDFPEPFSTVGRRDQTNVPAQSLTLMNDPFVVRQSEVWAEKSLGSSSDLKAQIGSMIQAAFAREATTAEVDALTGLYQESFERIKSVAAEHEQARSTVQQLQALIAERHSQIREQILTTRQQQKPLASSDKAGAGSNTSNNADTRTRPYLQWRFDATETIDSINQPSGLKLIGQAKISAGSLVVGQDSYAISAPIKKRLREKTLAVVVQLDDLNQRGGGAMTIQSADGSIFDSIVYAEQNPKQWLAGSNVFTRTQGFEGTDELAASSQPVHIAIAYDADGTIRAYRDGKPYGTTYRSAGVQEFAADASVVTLGLRHLPPGGNRFLSARIFRAQLFDQALTSEEIVAIASNTEFVGQEEILAAMNQPQRQEWNVWQQQLTLARGQLESLQAPVPQKSSSTTTLTQRETEKLSLAQVARAIFTLKEFIYVP